MEWIDFRENKPKTDIRALIFNDKGFMRSIIADYHSRYDVWKYYEPKSNECLLLEVTHYFPLPDDPKLRNQ